MYNLFIPTIFSDAKLIHLHPEQLEFFEQLGEVNPDFPVGFPMWKMHKLRLTTEDKKVLIIYPHQIPELNEKYEKKLLN